MSRQAYLDTNDEALMEQYRLGDSSAFEELYRRHSARVYGYLCKRLPPSGAQDAFQDAFLKLHKNRSRYDASYPLLPWLFTIVRHACIDARRKNLQRPEAPLEAGGLTASADRQPPLAELLPASSQLTETERRVLSLRYGNDLAFDEIAERLHLQAANVRKVSSRAVQKLKRFFQSER